MSAWARVERLGRRKCPVRQGNNGPARGEFRRGPSSAIVAAMHREMLTIAANCSITCGTCARPVTFHTRPERFATNPPSPSRNDRCSRSPAGGRKIGRSQSVHPLRDSRRWRSGARPDALYSIGRWGATLPFRCRYASRIKATERIPCRWSGSGTPNRWRRWQAKLSYLVSPALVVSVGLSGMPLWRSCSARPPPPRLSGGAGGAVLRM